ncbi:unnamed protein product [Urochloa humidicola]
MAWCCDHGDNISIPFLASPSAAYGLISMVLGFAISGLSASWCAAIPIQFVPSLTSPTARRPSRASPTAAAFTRIRRARLIMLVRTPNPQMVVQIRIYGR